MKLEGARLNLEIKHCYLFWDELRIYLRLQLRVTYCLACNLTKNGCEWTVSHTFMMLKVSRYLFETRYSVTFNFENQTKVCFLTSWTFSVYFTFLNLRFMTAFVFCSSVCSSLEICNGLLPFCWFVSVEFKLFSCFNFIFLNRHCFYLHLYIFVSCRSLSFLLCFITCWLFVYKTAEIFLILNYILFENNLLHFCSTFVSFPFFFFSSFFSVSALNCSESRFCVPLPRCASNQAPLKLCFYWDVCYEIFTAF